MGGKTQKGRGKRDIEVQRNGFRAREVRKREKTMDVFKKEAKKEKITTDPKKS